MLSEKVKQEIISQLQQVPTGSIWGCGIQLFLSNVELRTDEDFERIVKDIKSQMIDGPNNMKTVMGPAHDYFKNFPATALSA